MTTQRPFPQSYWVRAGLFCAGHYPGDRDGTQRIAKATGLLDAGIRRVISLIPEGETGGGVPFVPYEPLLQELAAPRGLTVECIRLGYPDGTTPTREHMRKVLDTIDASLAANEPLYLHCWGGHGRTGTTVGCFLIRHGASAQATIDQILTWRAPLPNNRYPFEGQQEAFVRSWQAGE
jgi:hypothetical protein